MNEIKLILPNKPKFRKWVKWAQSAPDVSFDASDEYLWVTCQDVLVGDKITVTFTPANIEENDDLNG